MSDYTYKLKKKRNLFLILDMMIYLVTPLIMVILAMSHLHGSSNILGIFSDHVQEIILSFGAVSLIAIIASFILRDRLRTFLLMCSLIIATALYNATGMWIIIGIWFTDEYIIHALYKKYQNKYVINKEIDKRE